MLTKYGFLSCKVSLQIELEELVAFTILVGDLVSLLENLTVTVIRFLTQKKSHCIQSFFPKH